MLRPLAIGLPITLAVVLAFVVGMNTVPVDSPYFSYVIIGYVVLFPAALLYTIIGTIRAARRATLGGDPTLATRGRRATATVVAAKPSSMTMRIGGGMPMRILYVTLKIEDVAGAYELKTTRTMAMWDTGVAVGTPVPVYVDPDNKKNVFVAWDEAAGAPGAAARPFGVQGSDGVNVQTSSVVFDARNGDLSQVPPGLRQLLQMGLNLAQQKMSNVDPAQLPPEALAKLRALGIQLGDPQTPTHTTTARGVVHQIEAVAQAAREEGRARIETLQPNPDGTYELELFVTPKSRASYRLTVALPVPQEHQDKMKRGQYLQALLDPASPETIEIEWEKL